MFRLSKKHVVAIVGAAFIAAGTSAFALPREHLASQASVTIARARAAAKHLYPGTIISEELERERGGSGLRYTFDIKGASGTREIGIDAKTGAVLENSPETGTPRGEAPDKD